MGEKQFKAERRMNFLETGFSLFSTKGISSVSMQEVADKSGCGIATLYRYFHTKAELVVAVSAWKWSEYYKEINSGEETETTAAQDLAFFLDSFVDLYRNHKDLLRFNQFFNIYVFSEQIGEGELGSYQTFIRFLEEGFHELAEKAQRDGTMRTDIPEKVIFSTTLHLMMAAATRYAVGLVYQPEEGYDPEDELIFLRNALMEKYCC